MSATTTISISSFFQTVIAVDTRTGPPKIFTIPSASTMAGRLLIFKDFYGNAANSSFFLSTTGIDFLDSSNTVMRFASPYNAVSLQSDGIRNWRFLTIYSSNAIL